jgi:hypothetical protein
VGVLKESMIYPQFVQINVSDLTPHFSDLQLGYLFIPSAIAIIIITITTIL